MSNIFVFTAGKKEARSHLNDSIKNPVPLERIQFAFSSDELNKLRDFGKSEGGLYAWGAVPGLQNIRRWNMLHSGDYILTVYSNEYRFVSRVLWAVHNESAAEAIWGRDVAGRTWEYMYFLSKPRHIKVHVGEVSNYLHAGYKGFTDISSIKNASITAQFGSVDLFIRHFFNEDESGWHIPDSGVDEIAKGEEAGGTFSPGDMEDAREKTMRAIAVRRGQPKFRSELLEAYGSKCAVTGCDVAHALEAAHIVPFNGDETNHVQNGLLLRADIHTLYDLGLLVVDESYTIRLSEGLRESVYREYDGATIAVPSDADSRPSVEAIKQRNGHPH